MKSITPALFCLLGAAVANVSPRSLSYRMKSSEAKACFYAQVSDVHSAALLQVYYAASDARGTDTVYVDAVVTGPSGQQIQSQKKQTHAELSIKPTMNGEYALCISHSGQPADKDLDIEITLPSPPPGKEPPQAKGSSETTAKLEKTVQKLHKELSDLVHTMRYIKNRERRNLETVDTIESYIFYISVFEVLLIVGMSTLQVVILRTFFSGSGRKQQRV